ncbi:ABC transporter permease [candidate division KSB1 bacterium]
MEITNRNIKPPKIASWLFTRFIPCHDRESFLYDMEEVYRAIYEKQGKIRVYMWVWLHLLRSLPSFINTIIYWSFVMFKNYLKTAFRNLMRNKVISGINIIGLAVGIACCILIILFIQDELSYDRFHKNGENIFEVYGKLEIGNFQMLTGAPIPMGKALEDELPEVINSVQIHPADLAVKVGENVYRERTIFTDPSFFNVFSFEMKTPQSGDLLAGINEAVITESLSKKYFGDSNAEGKSVSVLVNGMYKDFIISGVVKNFPANSSLKCDILLNIGNIYGEILDDWNSQKFVGIFVLLNDNNTAGVIEEKIPSIVEKHMEEKGFKFFLQPLTDYHLKAKHSMVMKEDSTLTLSYILSGIAIFVLLIACFNFMNLAIGNSTTRTKEIGVRKVVGADKKHILRQFISESFIQSFFALIIALFLIVLFLPAFNFLSHKSINIKQIFNTEAMGAIVIITLFTGLIAGSYPSVLVSRFKTVELFREKMCISGRNVLTKSLIVLQFSISIFLIITTLFLNNQYGFMLGKDLGYSCENVIVIPVQNASDFPDGGRTVLTALKKNMQNYREVESVSGSLYELSQYFAGTLFEDKEGKRNIVFYNSVDMNYLSTLKIDLIEGRNFSYDFPADREVSVIVNETFVKKFNVENPIGRKFSEFFQNNEKDFNIIGVIKDFHSESLHNPLRPTFLRFSGGSNFQYIYIRINPANIQYTLSVIKKELNNIAPSIPFLYNFLDDLIEEKYETEKRWSIIVKYSSVFAVLIACSGLFGLTMLTLVKRSKEISIRKVLGASVYRLLHLIQREFILLIGIANVIAWPAAYFTVKKVLENFAYKVPVTLIPFISAGIIAGLIALLTISSITVKRAGKNPVDNLRSE